MIKQISITILALVLLTSCCKDDEPSEIITESEIYNDFLGFCDISFANEMVGYIATGYNFSLNIAGVLKTTDCGATWQFYPVSVGTTPSSIIRSIYALNTDTIYATFSSLNESCGVCWSVDGGASWRNLGNFSIPAIAYGSVFFKNSKVGFVNSGATEILKTTDGGSSWESKYFGSVNRFIFTSSEVGYACTGGADDYGSSGHLLKTTNGGDTWARISALSEYITSMEFVNDDIGYVFTYNNRLYKTINGGQDWTLHQNLPGGLYYTAAVAGSTKYFAVMSKVYKSTNDYKNYKELYTSKLNDASFYIRSASPSKKTAFFLTQHTIIKITQR